MELLGQALKALRERAGLNQTELAKAVGMTQGMISQFEKGMGDPSLSSIKRIADYFSTTPAKMLAGEVPARTLDSLRVEAIGLIAVADLDDVTAVLLTLKGESGA